MKYEYVIDTGQWDGPTRVWVIGDRLMWESERTVTTSLGDQDNTRRIDVAGGIIRNNDDEQVGWVFI